MSEPRHEIRDVDAGVLAKLGAGVLVLTLLVLVAMYAFVTVVVSREAEKEPEPSPYAASPAPFVGPRLQVDPPAELEDVRRAEQDTLASYGWVDRNRGAVRIPIERAMELLVERGLTGPAAEDDDETSDEEEPP